MGRFLVRLACLAAAASVVWTLWLPDPRPLRKTPPTTTAYIELRKRQAASAHKPFALRWTWVPYDAISEHLKRAVVVAEDDVFWRHRGLDWDGMRAAWERDLAERRLAYGGSTITQQLARNLYLSPSKNPLRKIKEALIARRLEKVLGKRRILELYLNTAEWGPDVFGCEAAAQAYFGKPAADLTPEEAVAMAVVLPNPRRWSPARRGPYVERNSRRIVARMQASGLWPAELDAEAADAAMAELSLSTPTAPGADGADAWLPAPGDAAPEPAD